MELLCKVDSVKTLTKGVKYEGKFDGKGQLRIKGDDGRWNKYSPNNFDVLQLTQEDIDVLSSLQKTNIPTRVIKVNGSTQIGNTAVNATTTPETLKTQTETKFEESKEKVQQQINNNVGVQPVKKKLTLRSYLESQGVASGLIDDLSAFRRDNNIADDVKERIAAPKTLYQGGKVWTAAITALLSGRHILLEGEKATGKNVLADNLSFVFGRPMWDISFHTHMDASSLIGAETFRNNQVEFRPGSVYNCALHGGFGVLDEINMAKPEASAVLHSVLDDRRVIDVPGYDRIKLHDATRFIGTMNYGYVGTRELNEALASRFVIISVPALSNKELNSLLASKFPTADVNILEYFSGLFEDLQLKAKNAEISTKTVDLRGVLSALEMISRGMKPYDAVEVCIVNKAFEEYERNIVKDLAKTRIAVSWEHNIVFPNKGTFNVNFGGVK
jgi:nitric oxide reductase NorQ protein